MKIKNVVLLTTKYSNEKENAWLTNELAYALAEDGVNITVVVFSWLKDDASSSFFHKDGVQVLRLKLPDLFYKTGFIGTALKTLVFPWWSRYFISKRIEKCDLLIANTPCITILGLSHFFKKKFNSKSYLVLWDFFPFYLRDLGKMRNKLSFYLFHYLESCMYRSFDKIGCMTQGNIKFLMKNFKNIDKNRVEILRLWTIQRPMVKINKFAVRERFGLSNSKFTAIYGGAMSIVQDLDNILDVALAMRDDNILFLFVGKGTERGRLQEKSLLLGLDNVVFIDYIPRNDYEELVASCDVGLISLSANLTVPSFPSKSIDYFKVSLPVLASLDKVTDFGKILEEEIGAGYAVRAGDVEDMVMKLRKMMNNSEERNRMGVAGREYYENYLSVGDAKDTILNIV